MHETLVHFNRLHSPRFMPPIRAGTVAELLVDEVAQCQVYKNRKKRPEKQHLHGDGK